MSRFASSKPSSATGAAAGSGQPSLNLAHGSASRNAPDFNRPRVRLVTTEGEQTPAGASYTPPTPAPLPERGAGWHLFLSMIAAVAAMTFLLLLLQKV